MTRSQLSGAVTTPFCGRELWQSEVAAVVLGIARQKMRRRAKGFDQRATQRTLDRTQVRVNGPPPPKKRRPPRANGEAAISHYE